MDTTTNQLLDLSEYDATAQAADAFVRLVVDYFASTRRADGPVSTPMTPAELSARFDEPLPRVGQSLDAVVERLRRDVVPDSNHLCHPRSLGHQVSAPLPAAVWAESLVGALNQSGAVWEMSPVGTVIEHRVVSWMCNLAGLGPHAGGTFTSGGTEATFTALLAARAVALPDAWEQGVGATPPAVVCGEHAHYGVARAVGELGLGTRNIIVVPSRSYRMDIDALGRTLERLRLDGRRVMAVVATAGTTATGSFDDLDAIGQSCARYGTWFHVDAAHGGSALLSAEHRHRLKGIERANSIAWDPHKMMLMPLTASMLLVADESALEQAFSQRAPYLFHRNGDGRTWDQGLRTFQCSRRLDAIKLWVALQRYGADHIGRLYERLCATARELYDVVRARPDFEGVNKPESNIVCFRYVGGEDLRTSARDETADQLDQLNEEMRARFNRSGEGWITVTSLGGRRVLRVTVMNPRTTRADLERVVEGLARTAREVGRVGQETEDCSHPPDGRP